MIRYTYQIIHAGHETWGYDIYSDGKLQIHQITIPARQGNNGFKKKSTAAKAATLVIRKLKLGEMPPTMTIEEIEKLEPLSSKTLHHR